MASRSIVEHFYVLEDRQAGLLSRSVVLLADELGLERVEEALDQGVVEAVSRVGLERTSAGGARLGSRFRE